MTYSHIQKLLSISGNSLASLEFPRLERFDSVADARFRTDLSVLLSQKNGFYAFESALHVFPSTAAAGELGLFDWNTPARWIDAYEGLADACVFFAEDVFGGQFCARANGIHSFEPETGALALIANDLDGWACQILDDYDALTGYSVAHSWQKRCGAIAANTRLLPKVPFVTGGAYDVENLYAHDSTKGMLSRANLAVQIRDLPDGAAIKWKIVD